MPLVLSEAVWLPPLPARPVRAEDTRGSVARVPLWRRVGRHDESRGLWPLAPSLAPRRIGAGGAWLPLPDHMHSHGGYWSRTPARHAYTCSITWHMPNQVDGAAVQYSAFQRSSGDGGGSLNCVDCCEAGQQLLRRTAAASRRRGRLDSNVREERRAGRWNALAAVPPVPS